MTDPGRYCVAVCRVHAVHRYAVVRKTHPACRAHQPARAHGFSLVELLLAMALAAMLLAALGGVAGQVTGTLDQVTDRNELNRQARFAMDQMAGMVGHSRLLLLPLNDKPWSNWLEHIREETVPPTTPTDDSTKYTAVLAVTLPAYVDLDGDGFPDADDDQDGLIDEDLPNDIHHDFTAGIMLIDDDGDGAVDEGSNNHSDDESSTVNDDPVNGVDDDNDNNVDEDPASDNNGDGCPGICGVDDDGDGQVDEGAFDDDDEDGGSFDDPYDPVVFYLDNGTLMQRMPVPWDTDGISVPDGPVDGRDFVASAIAENVTRFRVERVPGTPGGLQLVDLTLELTSPETGEMVSVQSRVRVGGAL